VAIIAKVQSGRNRFPAAQRRVARWFVFKPKIPIWVNFGGSCYGKYFMTIWSTYFTVIGNTLWPFGIFCSNLVYFPRFGILDQEKSGNPGRQVPG
jgi:hypothetical protein